MIIDSHVHISSEGDRKKNFFEIKKDLFLSMKKYGITYSIVIPDNVPNPQCADMKNLDKIINKSDCLFMMGTIDIFKNLNAQIRELEVLAMSEKICAIKLFPGHDPFYPTDRRCQSVYELCLKYNLPVVFHAGINSGDVDCAKHNDPKYLVELSEKYNNLKMVIAHYFWPQMEYCYKLTKNIKNIYYDTSAIADQEVVEASGGREAVLEILNKTFLEKPDNVLFGTDWPMCPVSEHIKLIKDMKLGIEMEKKIFSLNAINLYKLKI